MSLTPQALTATLDPTIFLVPEDYIDGTLAVYAAGILNFPGADYVVSGSDGRTVTFSGTPPAPVAGTWATASTPVVMPPTYISEDDMKLRVGGDARWTELTDDDQDNSPDTAVVLALLNGIEMEVNGYLLAAGHDIPITADMFALIKNNVLDIANYRAKTRGDRQCSDDDRNLYKLAVTYMQKVASNDIVLVVLPEYRTPFALDSVPQIFTRDSLRKW